MKPPAQYHEITDHEEARDGSSSSPRSFGFVFTFFFLVIALAPLVKHGPIRIWALVAAGIVFGFACLAPQLLSVPNKIWLKFGDLLHRVTQPLILGILFYLVFTPIGQLMRIFQGDPLRREWDGKVDSYWISRTTPTPDSMIHLF
ncbi:MAG: SxtJ family membrane protein [Verrucomicrobiota bacterium]